MVNTTLAASICCAAPVPLLSALMCVALPSRGRHYLVRTLEEFWKLIGRTGAPHWARNVAGHVVHRLICRYQEKAGTEYTRFLRNPPQLDALARLQLKGAHDAALRVAIFGCSKGAEVYSVVWTLRSTCPEVKVQCAGIDISEPAVLAARKGVYASDSRELVGVSTEMLDLMFDRRDGGFAVNESLREGVNFLVGDACDQRLLDTLGPQDIVMANNFLVHLPDRAAEACLYNLEKLVEPGGVLVVWGINLNIKTRVISALGLQPLPHNLESIHLTDRAALEAWPLKWWGLEPLDQTRSDWLARYCTIFRKRGKPASWLDP